VFDRWATVTLPAVSATATEVSGADKMEQFLVEAYGASMRIRATGGHHLLQHRRTDAGVIAVESAYQSADLQFEVEPLNKIVVTRTATSRLKRGSDDTYGRYDTGALFLMSYPELPYTARWMPGEIENTIIDPGLLARIAAATPARRPQPLRFTRLDPHSAAAAAQWQAAHSYVAGTLANLQAASEPLVIGSVADLLAAATLETFPNTALTDPTIEDRHDAHPPTLRRAIAFIDDNAHTDISVADIAAAAHVTVRAVQLAFRRHLGATPLDYLRQVRLGHAHRDLLAADPGRQSVTAIAYRWGFTNPSRFAQYYRRAYGVSPSRTLRS
jgi:AraC-like DNA-binding protein